MLDALSARLSRYTYYGRKGYDVLTRAPLWWSIGVGNLQKNRDGSHPFPSKCAKKDPRP